MSPDQDTCCKASRTGALPSSSRSASSRSVKVDPGARSSRMTFCRISAAARAARVDGSSAVLLGSSMPLDCTDRNYLLQRLSPPFIVVPMTTAPVLGTAALTVRGLVAGHLGVRDEI